MPGANGPRRAKNLLSKYTALGAVYLISKVHYGAVENLMTEVCLK